MIRHIIDQYTKAVPAVLEIPSKDHPYDASKDSILRRAKVIQLNPHYPTLLLSKLWKFSQGITFAFFNQLTGGS